MPSSWRSRFLQDLILRHFAHALFLLRLDLDAGDGLAAAEPRGDLFLALRYELAPFLVIVGEAFGRDCHSERDVALRLSQLGVFGVLDVRLPAKPFGQIGAGSACSRVSSVTTGTRPSIPS